MRIEIPDEAWKQLQQILHKEFVKEAPYLSAGYKVITKDLETARNSEELPDSKGNTLYVCELTGEASIQLNRSDSDPIPLKQEDKIIFPFNKLYLTNTAQAGKNIQLIISSYSFDFTRRYPFTMQPSDLQAQYTALIDSTITPLSASATYTSPSWFDAANYGFISVMSSADVAGTLYLQFSNDGTNLHYEEKVEATPLTLSDSSIVYYAIIKSDKPARYCRVHYVNGTSDQTKFSLYAYARVIR